MSPLPRAQVAVALVVLAAVCWGGRVVAAVSVVRAAVGLLAATPTLSSRLVWVVVLLGAWCWWSAADGAAKRRAEVMRRRL